MNINTRDLSFLNFNGTEMQWLKYNNLLVWEAWEELKASGLFPLTLNKCKGADLVDYKIYGNSIQDGTPTPEAPIEVESVGDKTKNLFNKKTATLGKNLNAVTGGLYNSSLRCVSDYIEVNSTEVYTFVYNPILTVSRYLCCYDKDKNYLGENKSVYTIISGNSSTAMTISFLLSEVKYIRANCHWNADGTASEIDDFLIYEGSGDNTYEPYGYRIPVKVSGKNSIDANNYASIYATITNNEDYYIVDTSYNGNGIGIRTNCDFEPGETISFQAKVIIDRLTDETAGTSITLRIRNITKNVYIYAGDNGYESPGSTIKLREEKILKLQNIALNNYSKGDVLEFRITKGNGNSDSVTNYITFKVFKDSIMLEKSSTCSDFEPYYEPITKNIYLDEPLRKVGDKADYIDFKNGKVVRKIKEKIFENTFNWSMYSTSKFLYASNDIQYIAGSNCYCSHYLGVSAGGSDAHADKNNVAYISSINKNQLWIIDNNYTDLASFKENISNQYENGTPLKLYYPLATEDPQPIELPNIPTHKGTTILSIDTTIQPSNAEVKYKGKP